MSKRRVMKKPKKLLFGLSKYKMYSILFVGAMLTLFLGGSLFSAFGVDSVWGADVQFESIKFMDTVYNEPVDLPFYAFNVGSRTITADFDGNPMEDFDWVTDSSMFWSTGGVTHNLVGMKPTVNYDLSTFKYFSDLSEELAIAKGYLAFDTITQTADAHFFFGFSVGFSTAARSIASGGGFAIFVPSPETKYPYLTEGLVDCDEVDMFSEVAIRFNSTADNNLNYTGSVNSVFVVREYGYYVTQLASYTGEYDIETFNTDFLWLNKAHRVPGIAESLGAPVITYNVIDSTSEDMATIKVGAKLRPAIDPWDDEQYESPFGEYDGWIETSGISIYNVGYIYDLIIDVSINDIPLTSDTADTLLGRMGITINPLKATPIWWEPWLLIAVGAIVFLLTMNRFGSRG